MPEGYMPGSAGKQTLSEQCPAQTAAYDIREQIHYEAFSAAHQKRSTR